MISALIKILDEEISSPGSPLYENYFAERMIDFLGKSGEIPDGKRLLSIVYREDSPVYREKEMHKAYDSRIKKLLLRNVRQYQNKDGTDEYYVVDFTERLMPASTVIHGANGSGKTTLYAALEYLYLGESKIADSHGAGRDYIGFLRSIGNTGSELSIMAEIEQGAPVESNRLMDFELPSAFCSECDYFEITRKWSDITEYVASEMGYKELFALKNQLTKLVRLLNISFDYRKIEEDVAKLKVSIDKEKSPEARAALNHKKESLLSIGRVVRQNFTKIRGGDYNKGVKTITVSDNGEKLTERQRSEVGAVAAFLKNQWIKILDDLKGIVKPIFDTMMKSFLVGELESLSIDTAKGSEVFKTSLNVSSWVYTSRKEEVSPIAYFNTFRLKLFCIAFKMSLFCCARILHGKNLPFVVDDIFDSSDFCNRSRIGGFIHAMFKAHDDAMKEYPKFPMQLIFFTQDNLIGENVFHGVRNYVLDLGKESSCKIKYGRLYNPNECVHPKLTDEPDDGCDDNIQSDEMECVIDDKVFKTTLVMDVLASV